MNQTSTKSGLFRKLSIGLGLALAVSTVGVSASSAKSVPSAKNAPYKKAGLTNLAAATRASFRNTGRQLDPDIVHRYPDDRKKTPSKK